jgi:hypothetical protein
LIAAFSSDGGVSIWEMGRKLKGRVFLGCLNPILRQQYIQLLSLFKIKASQDSHQVTINSKASIIKFKENIGFLDGVKFTSHSKKFSNMTKNELLNYVINLH